MDNLSRLTAWQQFWHQPVRAERLALMRVLLGLSLLTSQLFQYLPLLDVLFGPKGIAPKGLYEPWQLQDWCVTVLLFHHDEPWVVQPLFALWLGVTACWLVGWQTRLMNVLVWFLNLSFVNRNLNMINGGDAVLSAGIFLLMLSPCGRALSVDSWLRHRRKANTGPDYIAPWPIRLIQIELCLIYTTSGLLKLKGTGLFEGAWWDGTAVHNVLNDPSLSRLSYTQLPQPFWLTATLTYLSVWWEVLFPLLMLSRPTRIAALVFGILFHLGIWFTIEVGWFSFYTLSFYAVWVPNWFWDRYPGALPRPVT